LVPSPHSLSVCRSRSSGQLWCVRCTAPQGRWERARRWT